MGTQVHQVKATMSQRSMLRGSRPKDPIPVPLCGYCGAPLSEDSGQHWLGMGLLANGQRPAPALCPAWHDHGIEVMQDKGVYLVLTGMWFLGLDGLEIKDRRA